MAKTAAERQAAYRARRPHAGNGGNGERRLNVWIDTRASLARALASEIAGTRVSAGFQLFFSTPM
jgi:hypothetical protein